MKQWTEPRGKLTIGWIGLPQHRESSAPSAAQRRNASCESRVELNDPSWAPADCQDPQVAPIDCLPDFFDRQRSSRSIYDIKPLFSQLRHGGRVRDTHVHRLRQQIGSLQDRQKTVWQYRCHVTIFSAIRPSRVAISRKQPVPCRFRQAIPRGLFQLRTPASGR